MTRTLSRWLLSLGFFCLAAAHAQDYGLPDEPQTANFGGFRITWPPPDGRFFSAFSLETRFQFQLDAQTALGIHISDLSLPKQRASLAFTAPAFRSELGFGSAPSFEAGSRFLALAALLAYTNTEPSDPSAPAFLQAAIASYNGEIDTSLQTGYRQHRAGLGLSGSLAPNWSWSASYNFLSLYEVPTSVLAAYSKNLHNLDLAVRTQLLPELGLALLGNARLEDGRGRYQAGPELTYALTELESLSGRFLLNSDPGYEVSSTLLTRRFQPLILGVTLGRSNASPILYGASVQYTSDFGLQASLNYLNRLNVSQSVSWSVTQGIGVVGLGFTGSYENAFDPSLGQWVVTLTSGISGSLSLGAFSLSGNGSLEGIAGRWRGRIGASASYVQLPWLFAAKADLRGVGSAGLIGEASLKGLYFIFSDLAISLTGLYQWWPGQGVSGPGIGLGLRRNF